MTSPRNAKTTAKGRTYRWRDETFDSVTTIIGGGIPKPALTNWAAKEVAEYVAGNLDVITQLCDRDTAEAIDLMKRAPWRKRDKAGDLGSLVHRIAEHQVLGVPMPPLEEQPIEAQPYVLQFMRFLDEWKPTFELTEASVYNRTYGYAGTLDAIVAIEMEAMRQRWLIDYKTAAKGPYDGDCLQQAAYRHAEFVGMPDGTEAPMPAVDRVGILKLTPTDYELIPVEAGEDEFRMFRYVQQVRWFVQVRAKEVFGAPLGLSDLTNVLELSLQEAAS